MPKLSSTWQQVIDRLLHVPVGSMHSLLVGLTGVEREDSMIYLSLFTTGYDPTAPVNASIRALTVSVHLINHGGCGLKRI